MTRLITNGDPVKVLESIGIANNMLAREKSKMGDGAQTRVIRDGIELRLNASGIDQIIIDTPVKQDERIEIPEEPSGRVVIYAYEGAKNGPISALSRKAIIKRSLLFCGTMPAANLVDALSANTIVIMEPIRALTDTEKRLFNKHLRANRNIFIYSGSDILSFNAILGQLGSNLMLIPNDEAGTVGRQAIVISEKEKFGQPSIKRGFLHPVRNHELTSLRNDIMGQMMMTDDVVVLEPYRLATAGWMPGFDIRYDPERSGYYPFLTWSYFKYIYGAELINYIKGWGVNLKFIRNSLISASVYPHDWSPISESEFANWLGAFGDGIIRQEGGPMEDDDIYTYVSSVGYDPNGYRTYSERSITDYYAAFAAREKGKTLYVFGYSPYWMHDEYDYSLYDKTDDVGRMGKWMAKPERDAAGVFGAFITEPPFLYYNDMPIYW